MKLQISNLTAHFLVCDFRYDKDIQLFKSKVVDSVKLCNSHLFDQPKFDDPYAIRQVGLVKYQASRVKVHVFGFVCFLE